MRIQTLIRKEFLDLARNRAALVPVVLVTAMSLVLPFGIAILIPMLTGRGLGDDADLVKVSATGGIQAGLSNDARVQLFLFQQFLMLFLLTPITGAMALAAHAIVGEKQARTLEPLLATPITTFELLAAKVFGALILLVAPAAALVSLQAAILISSRVNDARTAQQFGVLIILPLTGILVAQFTGTIWLSAGTLALLGIGLLAFWILLTVISVALFDRESILTRWK